MRKPLWIAALALVLNGIVAQSALACACTSVSPFPSAAKSASVLILGQVVSSAPSNEQAFFHGRNTRRFLDVDVIRVVGRRQLPNRVRIWDPFYGTSCEGAVVPLPANSLILVSVVTRKDIPAGVSDIWSIAGISPRSEDLFIGPACAEVLKILEDPPRH